MTRREQIMDAAMFFAKKNKNNPSPYLDFVEAAEWADRTMIEKACEWITEHIDIPYEGEFIDDSPVASDYVEWCKKRLEYAKAIADAFRKAMEE